MKIPSTHGSREREDKNTDTKYIFASEIIILCTLAKIAAIKMRAKKLQKNEALMSSVVV